MKKFIIGSIIIFFTVLSPSQGLLDIYKGGTVTLIPDTEFAKGNDWDKIFASFTDSMGSTHIGARKSMVFTPDGSLVVSHAYRDFYSLFGADGKFVKEFEVSNHKGGREKNPGSISDIIGGNTFIAEAYRPMTPQPQHPTTPRPQHLISSLPALAHQIRPSFLIPPQRFEP